MHIFLARDKLILVNLFMLNLDINGITFMAKGQNFKRNTPTANCHFKLMVLVFDKATLVNVSAFKSKKN